MTRSTIPQYLGRWKWPLAYSAFILGSAGVVGTWVQGAYGWLGFAAVRWSVTALFGIAVLLLLAHLLRIRNALSVLRFAALAGLAAVYALALVRMAPLPIEKVHFIEYGILGYLAYEACRKGPGGTPLFQALSVVLAVGFLDEIHQGLLAGRTYDPRDVVVNVVAGLLGLLLTLVLRVRPPARPTGGLLHRGNLPFFLVWPAAGLVYVYLHAVPLPTTEILGTWTRTGDCRVEEWLRFRPDGTFEWWDEEGNRATARYRLLANRLEGLYFRSETLSSENPSDCGWRPGMRMDLKVTVTQDRLTYLESPDRPWVRDADAAPVAPPDGGNRPASGMNPHSRGPGKTTGFPHPAGFHLTADRPGP